ncbi:hypothetical protein NL108_015976 [Boleophthalmus pectinirostris]|uniref:O(6)-methylguanine-induced apoptosis 2 n=1 Tax=Boleophthalmus pectinirostris TaxID=150288 RepID=UPI00242E68E6|nr:O(6)-methylguanine-induced apoptosis 2 [Boleophthalmus pectinirostris]KAJ0055330.1 hypothetical protein NL108_015976 [Boleophthalmus pectinirostris]
MGNLYRDTSGHVVSIPSKYKTMTVINNSEKKGFCSQTKRFPSQHRPTENPGPGSYNYNFSNIDVNCPSFSTKGTTGFVVPSMGPRVLSHPLRHVPGPNAYNLQSSLINKCDFNTGVSRVFRAPVAVQPNTPKNSNPAPNQYDVQNGVSQRFGPPGSSAFISKTKRDPYRINKDLPSPCHYYIEDDFQRVSKAVLSPFRSKTQRLSGPKDNLVPGPGAYSPHQSPAPTRRSHLHRRSVVLLSAAPLAVPKPAPTPGPGHYDVSMNLCSKLSVPSAAFASKTQRSTHIRGVDAPGPGFYDPHLSTKQSFFYNDSRIWLPV